MCLALLGAETGALPVGTAALLPQEIQLLPYGLNLAQGDPAQPLHWGCCPVNTAAVCSQKQGSWCSCSEQSELSFACTVATGLIITNYPKVCPKKSSPSSGIRWCSPAQGAATH